MVIKMIPLIFRSFLRIVHRTFMVVSHYFAYIPASLALSWIVLHAIHLRCTPPLYSILIIPSSSTTIAPQGRLHSLRCHAVRSSAR